MPDPYSTTTAAGPRRGRGGALASLAAAALLQAALAGCTSPDRPAAVTPPPRAAEPAPDLELHDRRHQRSARDLASLPRLGGFVGALRERARERGGAVLLVDAGDMFQGTLESNLGEGAAAVRGYAALGYDAAAIGNHEFDFGPVGLPPSPAGSDPQGALRARAEEAPFPFLAANLYALETRAPLSWKNVRPSVVVTRQGVRIGVVGVTTKDTPRATAPASFAGLGISDPAEAIAREAAALRAQGATVVLALAHAGGACAKLDEPSSLASCDPSEEIMSVVPKLAPGLVDADVALLNAGGLRADLPEGELEYGQLFEAMPFDDLIATVRVTAGELRALLTRNLASKGGILSTSGVRVIAECRGEELVVKLTRSDGRPLADAERLTLATSEFLATGGDGTRFAKDAITVTDIFVRDRIEAALRARGGVLRAADYAGEARRLTYPGSRPVRCSGG